MKSGVNSQGWMVESREEQKVESDLDTAANISWLKLPKKPELVLIFNGFGLGLFHAKELKGVPLFL